MTVLEAVRGVATMDQITGGVLPTVNVTTDEVAKFPEPSRATAIIEWEPSATAVESHVTP
jgi:hypothetical protein